MDIFQLFGKTEYRTCEMAVNFVQDDSDIESGHIIAEIYGEEVIGWNKYIHALCAFKEDAFYADEALAYADMIKNANRKSEITIPVHFHLRGGKIMDMRVDFGTYSLRVEDERFADLEVRNHHVMNIRIYKKKRTGWLQ
ncbi:hypothetical protein [Oribacterium sp. P6A1]|uniref:hypothetical protein n=1 Tax=Oribacterium sp. P6A1 TaxID=1410612 RepID=UPI00055A26ED|nr:hypothetical protein [Oribacterium sp. P6A1]